MADSKKITKASWGMQCAAKLVGKTIKDCRYMTDKEMQENGWYKCPLVIIFTDGTAMYASADDEGNDGGSIFTTIKGLEVIPTI